MGRKASGGRERVDREGILAVLGGRAITDSNCFGLEVFRFGGRSHRGLGSLALGEWVFVGWCHRGFDGLKR